MQPVGVDNLFCQVLSEEGINRLALVENYNGQTTPQTVYVPITDDRGTLMGVVDATPGSANVGQLVEKLNSAAYH